MLLCSSVFDEPLNRIWLFVFMVLLFVEGPSNAAAMGIAIALETSLVPNFRDDFFMTELLNRLFLPLYPITVDLLIKVEQFFKSINLYRFKSFYY